MTELTQVDVKKYLQIILRRRYLFLAASILILSVIFWGSFFMPKIYEAKSTVFIERNIIQKMVKGMVITPSLNERLRVLKYAMMSRAMLHKVIEALDLDIEAKNKSEIESMVKDFQSNTQITIRGNDLLKVSYRGKNPKIVRDYVNTLISKYIEENTSSKREEAFSANQFLSEQINYYKNKLESAEEALQKFRIEKGIYFSVDEETMVGQIKAYRLSAEETEITIKELGAKKQNLEETLSGERPLSKSLAGGEKNILKQRLAQLEHYLPLLLIKNTENHPEVIKTRGEIETIREQMVLLSQNQESNDDTGSGIEMDPDDPVYQQLKEVLLLTDSEIDSMKAKVASLNTKANKTEEELKNIPEEKKALTALERERNTYVGIYKQLLSRVGQAEVSKQMEMQDKSTSFRIVDPAILPTAPVSPDRIKLALFGIIAGLAAGIGVVFLFEYFDTSIKEVDTLKSYLGLPVLAVIPKIVTDTDIKKKRRLDIKVYAISIVYLSIIGGVFIKELMKRFF